MLEVCLLPQQQLGDRSFLDRGRVGNPPAPASFTRSRGTPSQGLTILARHQGTVLLAMRAGVIAWVLHCRSTHANPLLHWSMMRASGAAYAQRYYAGPDSGCDPPVGADVGRKTGAGRQAAVGR